jgi:hypothetical protein
VVVCWSTMKPSLVIRQWQQALYTFTCHYNGLLLLQPQVAARPNRTSTPPWSAANSNDEYSRECLTIEGERSIVAEDVVSTRTYLFRQRGAPA